ncbi:hypothetical protein RYX36_031437 [Vicia faba]
MFQRLTKASCRMPCNLTFQPCLASGLQVHASFEGQSQLAQRWFIMNYTKISESSKPFSPLCPIGTNLLHSSSNGLHIVQNKPRVHQKPGVKNYTVNRSTLFFGGLPAYNFKTVWGFIQTDIRR